MKPHSTTTCLVQPAAEPVAVSELFTQLGMTPPKFTGVLDPLTTQLTNLLLAARHDCENYTRRAFMMRTCQMQLDRFPRGEREYAGHHGRSRHHTIEVPMPPLMAVLSLEYVDLTGTMQAIPYDPTFGAGPDLPAFTYQRSLGTETQPGKVLPGVFCWWPPEWRAEGAVTLQYRCGYNGPVTVSVTEGCAVVESEFKFAADDVGRPINIPGAGATTGEGETAVTAMLVTTIMSVDMYGVATLATDALTTAADAIATFGVPVPEPIRQAILILAQSYYNNGYAEDMPKFVAARLNPYCNWVS